ncbi:MAG TPA: metal-dependent hydrolase [Polyangiaceae bacterium]|jgi:hypothetical protein|nr:metal-dependent hydrolase [Polyangiaceae bacterium]
MKTAATSSIRARKVALDFNDEIPRHWLAKSPLATHLANSLNLLFPLGEKFFIRSVRAFQDRIDDPKLLEDIRGFVAQEGRHAAEHQRFFDVLRSQGYSIDTFLSVYEAIGYKFLERLFSPEVRLATTVACEHFTATFAEGALAQGFLQREAHPVVRDLLLWHAAEEIEHKSVAFDVLRSVAPSYGLRMAGLVIATATLTGFWMAGTLVLLAQEKDPGVALRHLAVGVRRRSIGRGDMARAFIAYMRPGFHPTDNDNEHLAKSHLAGIGHPSGAPAAAAAE